MRRCGKRDDEVEGDGYNLRPVMLIDLLVLSVDLSEVINGFYVGC